MRQIPLTREKFAIVDDEDYERVAVHNWQAVKRGRNWYGRCRLSGGTFVYMHHFILGHNRRTDHRNHNGLDNQKHNLRTATAVENACNGRCHFDAGVPIKGVHRHSQTGRYVAQIKVGNVRRHLGCFATPEAAGRAYAEAAAELQGEFVAT